MERLDKLLVSQGVGSRREVTALIRQGRVALDGTICRVPDTKIDPEKRLVALDGSAIPYKKYVYLMMNKPAGLLSARRDSRQETVVDLLPDRLKRRELFPAGRLDKDTEGLLLITDDGDFAHRMLSPKKEVFKLYEAVLDGGITEENREAFRNGITLGDGTKCRPAGLETVPDRPGYVVRVAVCEGKFHQVKRMIAQIDRTILHLSRIKIGALSLDPGLERGEFREMSGEEAAKVFSNDEKLF